MPTSAVPLAFTTATPSPTLPSAALPVASVPTKLPEIVVAVAAPVTSTPLPSLPEIRLPWGGLTNTPAVGSLPPVACPPISVPLARFVTRMPLPRFDTAAVPAGLVPMRFMAIALSTPPATVTPLPRLPEMTFEGWKPTSTRAW